MKNTGKALVHQSKLPHGGALVLIVLLMSSCTSGPASIAMTPSTEVELATIFSQPPPGPTRNAQLSTATPNPTYGVAVKIIHACSDGLKTTLRLQTELDLKYWRLTVSDLRPLGDAYFETATVFLDRGQLFSSTSSGKRDDPVFDLLTQLAKVDQTFIYPAAPSPNSQFMLKAEVTLANLPSTYFPPTAAIVFVAPGVIEIPIQFNLPVTVSTCR